MYHKIIQDKDTGSGTDLLLTIRRDDNDGERVVLSFWLNELYAEKVVVFEDLFLASSFIRDFSTISAVDFIDSVGGAL